jgi:hypothetical protein
MRLASLSTALTALQTHCSRRAAIPGLCAAAVSSPQPERGLCSSATAAASSDGGTHQYTWMAAVAMGFAGLLSLTPAHAAEPQPAQKPDFADPLVAAALQGVDTGLHALTSSPGGPGHATQMGVATPWSTSEAWADLLQRRRLAENRLRGYLAVKQRDVQAWWVPIHVVAFSMYICPHKQCLIISCFRINQLHAMGRLTPEEFQAQMERIEEEVRDGCQWRLACNMLQAALHSA